MKKKITKTITTIFIVAFLFSLFSFNSIAADSHCPNCANGGTIYIQATTPYKTLKVGCTVNCTVTLEYYKVILQCGHCYQPYDVIDRVIATHSHPGIH